MKHLIAVAVLAAGLSACAFEPATEVTVPAPGPSDSRPFLDEWQQELIGPAAQAPAQTPPADAPLIGDAAEVHHWPIVLEQGALDPGAPLIGSGAQ